MPDSLIEEPVLTCVELGRAALVELLGRYGLGVVWLACDAVIPGSYWGEREAGLIADRLFVRDDTPVHSALHEACHYICMDPGRRARLHTDAGGECDEENLSLIHICMQPCPASGVHADVMTGFMQGGMHRGIVAHE